MRKRYDVFEFSVPWEWKERLLKIANDAGMIMDGLTNTGLLYMAAHPEEVRAWKEEQEKEPTPSPITFVRRYTVSGGETEGQARERAIRDELAAQNRHR